MKSRRDCATEEGRAVGAGPYKRGEELNLTKDVRRPSGRALALAVLALAVLAATALAATGALAKPGNQGKGLGKGDRELVAAAKVNGEATVPLLIATQPGDASGVVSQLAKYG